MLLFGQRMLFGLVALLTLCPIKTWADQMGGFIPVSSSTPYYLNSDSSLNVTAQWEREKAIYQRDEDFAVLDQKKRTPNYGIKANLINAKFYVVTAGIEQFTVGNSKTAVQELNEAKTFLKRAYTKAKGSDQKKINHVVHKLEDTIAQYQKGGLQRVSQRKNSFDSIKNALKNLITGM